MTKEGVLRIVMLSLFGRGVGRNLHFKRLISIEANKLIENSSTTTIHATLDTIPVSEKIRILTDQVCSLNMVEVVQFTRLLKASNLDVYKFFLGKAQD